MCYALPGPRCSPHARTKLDGLVSRRDKKQSKLREIALERRDVRRELQESPSKSLKNREQSLTRQGAELKTQVSILTERARLAQIDYDGTPDGQRELTEAMAKAPTAKERENILRRIGKGRAKNASRRHMMESIKRSKESGRSLNQLRGNCIRLSNHDTQNVEYDQDLLSAA